MNDIFKGYQWYLGYLEKKRMEEHSEVFATRDVFRAHWNKMDQTCLKLWKKENEVSLLSAVIGELGNNCFDHNLGQWHDIPGCWFQYKLEPNSIWVVVTDRGQGILSSLKHVVPTLKDDQTALNLAFEKRISGRSPEQRGNGLKFVKNIINNHKQRGLLYLSGKGEILLGCLSLKAKALINQIDHKEDGKGTFCLVLWEKSNEN